MAVEYTTKKLKNGETRYMFDVNLGYDLNGKRIRKTITSKTIKDGRKKVSELRLNYKQLNDRTLKFEEAKELYINELENKVNQGQLSSETLANKICYFNKYTYFYNSNLEKISDRDIEVWQDTLSYLKDQTRNKYESELSGFFNWCIKKKLLADNPFKYIDRTQYLRKEVNILLEDEFHNFVNNMENKELALLLTTLFYTGLRFSEALGLKNEDRIDNQLYLKRTRIGKKLIVSSKFKTPKSKRIVPIPNWIVFPNKKGFIFDLYNSKTKYTRALDREIEKQNFKHFNYHELRHSYVSMLIDKGVDMFLISDLVGHNNITMTMNTYGHLYEEKRQNITSLFGKESPFNDFGSKKE